MLLKGLRFISLAIAVSLLLAGCRNTRSSDTVPTQIVVIPTNTLAPLITTTPRYTATLPPSDTPIPSITPTPAPTDLPATAASTDAPSPTPGLRGTISSNATLRSGPTKTSGALQTLTSGTSLTVLGISEDRKYYNVRLDDGTQGWIAQNLLTVADPSAVAVLSSAEQTRIAAITPGAASTDSGNFLAYRDPKPTDVLAYCDTFGKAHKTYAPGSDLTIWWSWFAKTPEQIQSHIKNAQYDVQIDGKALAGWDTLRTDVIRRDGKYNVYYYVPAPADALTSGDHQISYKVTWQAPINDGQYDWGPGTSKESDSGTCGYTIK